jgi:hypothetical protein
METNTRPEKPELIILIAIWNFLSAFGTFIGIGAAIFIFLPAIFATWLTPVAVLVSLVAFGALLLLAYIGLCVAAGIGLVYGKEWGRILAIIQAVFSLFSFPVGTTIGILIIIYLSGEKVKNYFLPNR